MLAKIFTITGPGGAGKTALWKQAYEKLDPSRWMLSVSHTTRKLRSQEQEGVDMHTVTKDEFVKMIDRNELLQWSKLEHNQEYYGTALKPITDALKKGINVIIGLNAAEAKKLKARYPDNTISIYVMPEPAKRLAIQLQNLKQRLLSRRESQAYIHSRIKLADKELKEYYLNQHFYDYTIVNKTGKLAEAVKKLFDIFILEGSNPVKKLRQTA